MEKPKLPKGVRDFDTTVTAKRNYIINIIKSVFDKYGFNQLETPAIENLDVLTGKYGEEGDQLIFKILNSGDFLSKVPQEELTKADSKQLTPKIAEKALRYDLTVPFARYVVMNRSNITFPFKRYQIQPVWRADRPQKGRYREFYQCDADVIGTKSLICEAEMAMMVNDVLENLGINDFTIYINNRKILSGISDHLNYGNNVQDICIAIDKLDKIGEEGVLKELSNKNIDERSSKKLLNLLKVKGNNEIKLEHLADELRNNQEGLEGIKEIREVILYLEKMNKPLTNLVFSPSLARGLTYYTGAIFEVVVNNYPIGSISGGGRYDELTQVFGLPEVSGVGISFGLDRVYDAMEALELFPEEDHNTTQILITNFDEFSETEGLKFLTQLRQHNIKTEIYPTHKVKMKKQFAYADAKNIPYVLVIGSEEIASGYLSLKDMNTGEQNKMTIEEVIKKIKNQ